ncbi:glycosyltransferase [Marinobacter salicampi]|uniref:glycosyltransferase n=1 Tax=Marinobacter salicampi TaxID=435907 RepID=UPI00140793A0|nr:glycosyltransferase [Marinobacter salicampi]
MSLRNPLKALFYLNLLIVVLLIGYKAYLNFFETDFEAVHTEQVEQLHRMLDDRDTFSFAVVGNINNSVGIFERKMIPHLNASGVDFMVSAGNAVSGGGEDKYRALHGTLGHLEMPYLLTFGQHEYEDFGSFRFYEHFGPHFYSVTLGNSRLVFLDSTGKTPWQWQIRWLQDVLEQDDASHTFLFVGHPVMRSGQELLFTEESDFLQPPDFREQLLSLIDEHAVNMVFSANLTLFDRETRNDTTFITTGGAGGLVLNNETSFYHYVRVMVDEEGANAELVRMETNQNPVLKRLETFWFFVYSLFYVGYINFILLVSVLALIGIKLYTLVFVGHDYYPNYDLDPSPWLEKPLRVAMFTNNYLPFIGGVPISIDRLKRGLEAMGDQVQVVAPTYRDQPENEQTTVRVPSLLSMGVKREFRLANIFLARIRKQVRAFKPDIIHLHHPIWLGSLGLFMGRRLKVPVVYTYHTRLEHYAHFVPIPGTLFRNLISHALIKHFANKCDGVIVPTYSTEEYLRMIGVKSATYIQPTGIDYQRFNSVSDDAVATLKASLGIGEERVFVSVSRISSEKNIDFMIDAIASLKARATRPFRFLIIGDGHERDRIQQRIDSLGLQETISLLGAVPPDDMPIYYRLGDAFLFASKSETQGMVILEAMAAGLPVVAVRSSGIDDVVRQGYNGFKTPEKLALWRDKVALLLEDDELRRELGDNALAFARDYSIENFARDVRFFYATLLAAQEK